MLKDREGQQVKVADTPDPKWVDILRPLKEADSLGWRAMSRTESTDNVTSRVDIPIMQDATTRTGPLSYP